MAKWIWYSGDFEIYHSEQLHSRRTEYDYGYPPMWHVSRPEFAVYFRKTVDFESPVTLTIHAKGEGYAERIGGRRIGGVNREITLPAGRYDLAVKVQNLETFPAIFIDHEALWTDESWTADLPGEAPKRPAGAEPEFTGKDDDPAVFPFAYKDLVPVSVEPFEGGLLYDFGVESFGPVTVTRAKENGRISVYYGESREEALDTEFAYLREHLDPGDGEIALRPRAFRYIYLKAEKMENAPSLSAKLQYLPLEDIASFESDDPLLPRIWEICARAFHLNSREFFLDGIKRDRWVWSGDAYQSYMVNRYLYNDPAITKRTIRALLDKQPYRMHINTINDYSAYMFLGTWEYYFATGDRAFVAEIWENLKALYAFITERLDPETGYVVEQPGDWIFIDWHDFDYEGPLCAEQILLHEVYRVMAELSALMGEPDPAYLEKAAALKARILKDFWDEEKGAFIDSFTSGKRHVTRHANIFAILYDFVDEDLQKKLAKNILLKDEAKAITTPYFKLFELMALGKCGHTEVLQDYIDSYWGGMLEEGATSSWEEYIPEKHGIEHYEMYGDKFGCSLCHAWGAGPILLLGRYIAGVRPTSVGGKTWEVVPAPGRYQHFKAVVPIAGGSVTVEYRDGQVTAESDVPGGVLKFKGQETALIK